MSLETQQVTVQELSRLNDAIAMTMEAIRRVVPQLQQAQLSTAGQPWQQMGWSPQIDPMTAAYVQGHMQALRAFAPQMGVHFGQTPFAQPFGIGQTPFGVGQPWQQPFAHYGQPFGAPYLGQRLF